MTAISDSSHLEESTIDPSLAIVPWDTLMPLGSASISIPVQPSGSPTQFTLFHRSPEKGKAPAFARSNLSPPILRSSILPHPPLPSSVDSDVHLMIVEKVSAALDEGDMEEDSNTEEGSSEDDKEDEVMSDNDDPDDSMTLVQYQDEARHESLIRKGLYATNCSQKKGRVKPKGSSS